MMQILSNEFLPQQSQDFPVVLTKLNLDYDDFESNDLVFNQCQHIQPFMLDQASDSTSLSPNSKKIRKENSKSTINDQKTSPKAKRAAWTPKEDAQVIELVNKLGQKWTEIGRAIGDKTGKQVRERYLYTLKSDINKHKWTKEEDALLMSLYQEFGNKWGQIARHLPGRTENQIKNRLNPRFRGTVAFSSNHYDDNSSKASTQDIPETSPTRDDISPTIDLECYTSFEQCCESILEMSPVINTNDLSFPEKQLFW